VTGTGDAPGRSGRLVAIPQAPSPGLRHLLPASRSVVVRIVVSG